MRQQADPAELRRRLGRVGVWYGALGFRSASQEREIVAAIEDLGYPSLWVNESQKEVFAHAGLVLASSRNLTVATGIANVWERTAHAMVAGAETLGEAYDGRFILGIGIGHAKFVGRYERPLSTMRSYLSDMHETAYAGPTPERAVPWLVAALRTQMLRLSADQAQGSHPYFTPVEHTARARKVLGSEPVLAPALAVVLDDDPDSARQTARRFTKTYLGLPNYVNNLRTLGYDEADVTEAGSNRLIDAVVAWGGVDDIKRRVEEHLAAGADHVAIQVVDYRGDAAMKAISELAPAVL
ncbi:MAG: TIGR03620 family F420-dependent LLM class oxidoreductase [Nostocoides sp.]